jgi:alanine racemase
MVKRNIEFLSPPRVQKEYEDPWNKLVIDLGALQSNYNHLKSSLPGDTLFYTVLKSDAYGHDLVETAKVLMDAGCRHYAVETPQEGIRLRNEGIQGEILLMNPIPNWMAELSVRHDLSVSVIHESILEPLEDAARAMGTTCRIHLNANVGLNRMGIAPSKIYQIARKAATFPHIQLEGLFGQPRDPESAIDSFSKLEDIYQDLKSKNLAPRILHFANSTTFLTHPDIIADGVRIGILIYGVLPPEQFSSGEMDKQLKPAMSLKTEIVQVRQLSKGSRIGYRSKDITQGDLTIATIPLGYSHGLDRKISKGGAVLVHGKKAPFIGSVSMNSSTINVTGIEQVKIGDEVMIFGRQGNGEISINELASPSGTIAAELMMRFGISIPRDYRTGSEGIRSEIILDQNNKEKIHMRYIQTENELPEWISVFDIVQFLHRNQTQLNEPVNNISKIIDYALSTHPDGRGFLLLATANKEILGVVVNIQSDKIDSRPENLIVNACVHKGYREQGLGSRLIKEAIDCAEGNLKVQLNKGSTAMNLFKKLGFSEDYIEMLYKKKK